MYHNYYKYFKVSVLLVVFFSVFNTYGQSPNNQAVKVVYRSLSDSILLRWAPSSYDYWRLGNSYGYIVERFTVIKNGDMVSEPKGVRLTPKPLKPLPLKQWEPLSKQDDYIGVAAQAIYGESFDVSAQSGNGGIMDIVNKATDQENRFSFALFSADQSPLVARVSGLWFTDKNVKKGEGYLYRIYLTKQNEAIVDTGYIYASIDNYEPLPKPINFKASFGDKLVMLTWDKTGAELYYTSFIIEKSADEGKTFHPINDKPIINTSVSGESNYPFYFYIDSVKNNVNYSYRVLGISPFGEKGPYSDTISGTGLASIKDRPHIVKKDILAGDKIQLQWDFPNDMENTIDGFNIFRSDNAEKEFVKIASNIPPTSRTFTDNKPLPTNYYKVQAYKDKQTPAISLPVLVQLLDSIPPLPPVGITSTIDTLGIVRLKWDANKEPDMYGYRVYRANAAHEEFSLLTPSPVASNAYVDTINLKTLSKQVFYKITALDQRQNYSAFSEIATVDRPDRIAPVPPLIVDFVSHKKGIQITWENSSSSDALYQVIYRKAASDSLWVPIKRFSKDSINTYTDSTLTEAKMYAYMLKALDKAGNESVPSNIVKGKPVISNKSSLTELKYKINRTDNSVTISWESVKNAREYHLYKATGTNEIALYKVLNNQTVTFTDIKLVPGTDYTYLFKVVSPGKSVFYKKINVSF